jgi:peptidoglycan hydrolase-like protein with peptidoglycan-binding domain
MKKIIAIIGFFGLFASQMVTSSAAYFNSAPIVRCDVQITKTLQRGSENNDVYILQKMLVNAGFLNATPNGYFGYQTQAAVRNFQFNNGIRPTGTVGEVTRNAVNERLCDTDLIDNTYSYGDTFGNYGYGYSVGTTYVTPTDPFVHVVTPQSSNPTVYATPQDLSVASLPAITIASPYNAVSANTFSPSPVVTITSSPSSQVAGTGIVYNPSSGYTYGIIPQSGSVTVSSPVANSIYNEGDTVNVNWTTNNLQTSSFSIVLESNISGQRAIVATISGNSYSFVLTRELLDSVCAGTCNNNQQGSFKISVTTPTTDIAGINSTLRATVSPITIRRPLAPSAVSITTSKTPVNSGEVFKLYVNIPIGASWNAGLAGNYSVKVRALCGPNVSASIAGTPCGQDFVIPFAPTSFQQEIPASIINPTWYKQDVTFQLTVVNLAGQTIGVGETRVTANGAPFSW